MPKQYKEKFCVNCCEKMIVCKTTFLCSVCLDKSPSTTPLYVYKGKYCNNTGKKIQLTFEFM